CDLRPRGPEGDQPSPREAGRRTPANGQSGRVSAKSLPPETHGASPRACGMVYRPDGPGGGAGIPGPGHSVKMRAAAAYRKFLHIVEEIGTWLTPSETIVKDRLELPQFLYEPF